MGRDPREGATPGGEVDRKEQELEGGRKGAIKTFKDGAPAHPRRSNQGRGARRLARTLGLNRRNNSNAVFSQPFQGAMPQSAKFAIQEMFASDKRHEEIAALLDFATGLL